MGGYERGPQGMGNARMGLPGEEIDETEGTPYENRDSRRLNELPEHERDDDVAATTGGGVMSSGATATDRGGDQGLDPDEDRGRGRSPDPDDPDAPPLPRGLNAQGRSVGGQGTTG